jgi:hypothetical protein
MECLDEIGLNGGTLDAVQCRVEPLLVSEARAYDGWMALNRALALPVTLLVGLCISRGQVILDSLPPSFYMTVTVPHLSGRWLTVLDTIGFLAVTALCLRVLSALGREMLPGLELAITRAATVTAWWKLGLPFLHVDTSRSTRIVGWLLWLSYYVLAFFAVRLVIDYRYRRWLRANQDADMILQLLRAAVHASESATWSEVDERRSLAQRLDAIATTLETSWMRRAECPDSKTSRLMRSVAGEIAMYFRNLEKDVSLPIYGTTTTVRNQLASALAVACDGRWGDLPRAPMPSPDSSSRVQHVVQAVTTVLVAFSLPVALTGAEHFGWLQLAPPVRDFVRLGALVVAVVIVVASIDPELKTKLSILGQIKEALTLGSKDKR